ncbi:MAG TPA: type IV pilus secretin family protein [Gemmatimonadetes bacterium]|nr:type IV pilus secretin family protein [Gemmatimonadota bacterium]
MTSMFALWAGALLSLGGPVTEVAITPMGEQTSVLIAIEGDVEYRDFLMEGPHRLIVDLLGAQNALPRNEFSEVNRGGIRIVTARQYSEDVVRVVLELTDKVQYMVTRESRGVRITLENPQVAGFEPWSSGAMMSAFDPTNLTIADAPEAPQESQALRINLSVVSEPIHSVLLQFAVFSGKSVIAGANVVGLITAEIADQPWDVALDAIMSSNGLVAQEDSNGIIRVDNLTDVDAREAVELLLTQAHRINFATATELQAAITPLLSARGQITVGAGTNTLIVTDIQRVQTAVTQLLRQLDIQTPQVQITAKIIFVNRTDLAELGVTYEIKDSQGNQINQLSSGFADTDFDGVPETVGQGTAVISLGGNSIAAIGNATARVGSPTLQLLTSLVVGRHQLVSFLDALQTVNLSDIEAEPQVTTLDNQLARIHVGEITPIRTIDAGAGGGAGGTFPTASVDEQETGIILEATPHVTEGGLILLELVAERSAAELAEGDVGYIFRTQRAETRVLVADGESVVIAGLTQRERTEARSGIPLLMNLPLIGRLFRATREQEFQRDLIIIVTPHIVRSVN